MTERHGEEEARRTERALLYRRNNPAAAEWIAGYGAIQHSTETQDRIFELVESLDYHGKGDGTPIFELLHALDKATSAAMWLVAHQSYAQNVYLDGREMTADDFKPAPEGHMGGSLNMVPGYMGYMAANAITGHTRAWIMGQGHTVAAIDSVNLLMDNMTQAHSDRYSLSDEGLTRYVRDFYSYTLGVDGRQDSPLGSHVNAHTAGALVEGGYLGFTQLQYIHMPLPGERLVVFLSDGAFEEQRGSDWAPRWWRAEDSGLVAPIMISNGRRIDQRSTISLQGGVDWFVDHLRLNGFAPFIFDGRDPAAFVWAILEMEWRLEASSEAVREGRSHYPVPVPYGIAVAPKGAGFYGEGSNAAHNLPLPGNPHTNAEARECFIQSAQRLWVPLSDLQDAIDTLRAKGIRERDHALAHRDVALSTVPSPAPKGIPDDRQDPSRWARSSPMDAVDLAFVETVQANPHLRPRVGNPDEMRSNRLVKTLEALKFRAINPEPGSAEDVGGAIITALNEEAIASAALANKGGINLIHSYEAFGAKMHGVVRQEITFADQLKEAGQPAKWLSIPLVMTSHTWENGKNEISHQDPALAESLLNEPSDISRVLFPADYNTAQAVMRGLYQSHGQIWTLVVPKQPAIAELFTWEESKLLLEQGALRLDWLGHRASESQVVITAIGSYQLEEAIHASNRLRARDVPHSVIYMLEPGRFRVPRNAREEAHQADGGLVSMLFPDSVLARVFMGHTRPEPMLGVLQPLATGRRRTAALGFLNHGGTLTTQGMLFVNRSTWAHALLEVARVLDVERADLLDETELAALDGKASPHGVIID